MPRPAPADPNTPTPLTTMPTAPDMLPELELTMPPANVATFVTTIAALVAAMVPELVMPPLTKVTPQPQPTRMPVPAEMVPLFDIGPEKVPLSVMLMPAAPAVSAPMLVIPPAKVPTRLTLIPLPLAVMVPLLMMPPPNVETLSTTMAAPEACTRP